MTQCTYIKPKTAIEFKNPTTNRMVKIKANEVLWIMSSSTDPMRKQGAIMIGRKTMGMGTGWYVTLQNVADMFEVLG